MTNNNITADPVIMDGLVEPPFIEALRVGQQQLDCEGVAVGVSRQALDEALAERATLLATIERQREALEAIADVWSLPAVPMKAGGMKWHCQHEEWMASIADVARKALESQP